GHQPQDVIDVIGGRNGRALAVLAGEGDDQPAGLRRVVADDAGDIAHRLDDLAVAEGQAVIGVIIEIEAELVLRPAVVASAAGVTPAMAMPMTVTVLLLAADGDRGTGPVTPAAVEGIEVDVG